ncbi:MAG: hypothetical protein IJA20_02155 [Methanocorpusculum sp.]|nr:hypothetical protein [Oscillospiraceae bacterium]MBQ3569455.1 hypothetical protein [Methanocorpusculum sp.]
MDILDTALTPESLYAFMERIPYLTDRNTGVSFRLSVPLPIADDGDIVYCGEVVAQDRTYRNCILWKLIFCFSIGRGIYDITVFKNNEVVRKCSTMTTSEFYDLIGSQFTLNPPRSSRDSQRRCVWNTVPLMDVLRFLEDAPAAINSQIHLDITLHRSLGSGDIVYHGTMWTDGPPRKRKKLYDCYLEFRYSTACSLHDVSAYVKKEKVVNVSYILFPHFQKCVERIFVPRYKAPQMHLAETPIIIRQIRSS